MNAMANEPDQAQAINTAKAPPPLPGSRKKAVAPALVILAISGVVIGAVVCIAAWFVYIALAAKRDVDLSTQLHAEVAAERIKMLQHSMSAPHFNLTEEHSAEIRGTLTNTSGVHLESVSIDFNVMDGNGRKTDSVTTGIRNLKPLEVWAYRIPVIAVSDDSRIALDTIRVNPK